MRKEKKMTNVTGLTNFDALQTQNRMKEHAKNTSHASAQLASGSRINSASDDSSGAAIVAQMKSDISVLNQTSLNSANAQSLMSVATGTLDEQKDLLIQMKTKATAALDGSLSAENRAMINNEFIELRDQVQTAADNARWNGVSLMTGGAGTVTNAGGVGAANTGVIALADAFAANVTNQTGFASGQANEVSVKVSNAGTYDLNVKIGEQWFEAKNVAVTDGGTINFSSTVDSGAGFTLTFDAAALTNIANANGLSSAAQFEAGLKTTFGLTGASANANFLAESNAPANGLTSFTASPSTEAGTYAFRYDANSNELTLTNGKEKWTEAVTETGANQSVTFNNGITVNLDNTFAAATSIDQTVFDIARGDAVSLNFQIGEKASDRLQVDIAGTSLAALNLDGVDVTSEANAIDASTRIDVAISTVNSASSTLGAKQQRFESVQANLETRVANLTSAKSKIEDADIAEAMKNYTVSNTMSQISSVAFAQSLQSSKEKVGLVR